MKIRAIATLLLILFSIPAFGQGRAKISGYIRDADGNPLDLVNIRVKNTLNGTMSNEKGHYSLSVATGDSVTLGLQQGRTDHSAGNQRHAAQRTDELYLYRTGRSNGNRYPQANDHPRNPRCRPCQAATRPCGRKHRKPGRHLCGRYFQ